MSDLSELQTRLESSDAGVRRVAILDLIARRDAGAILITHLARERDERAALLIIRHLERVPDAAAMPVLLGLYNRRETAVRIAHAAILAHDRIEAGVQPRCQPLQ